MGVLNKKSVCYCHFINTVPIRPVVGLWIFFLFVIARSASISTTWQSLRQVANYAGHIWVKMGISKNLFIVQTA